MPVKSSSRRVPLRGSVPRQPPDSKFHPAPPDPSLRLDVTIVVRPKCSRAWFNNTAKRLAFTAPAERRYMSHDEFVEKVGASPAELKQVAAFARRYGLKISEISSERWCVAVTGTVAQMARAFAVDFQFREHPDGIYRTHVDAVSLPATIAKFVVAVIGLDSPPFVPLPQRKFLRQTRLRPPVRPTHVAEFYDFPKHVKGRGQTIGLIELGGGFAMRDIRAALGRKVPKITVVNIDGQQNVRFNPAEIRAQWKALTTPNPRMTAAEKAALANVAGNVLSIIETTMDLELAAELAPEANFVVYFAPETFHGKYHAFTAAIADRVNAPSVVSCSFGLREDLVPAGYMRAISFAVLAGSLKGITFCASSGDAGSGPEAGQPPIVQFPASCPWVLACGGTSLHLETGRERVWEEITFGRYMASGGGFSKLCLRPNWAAKAQRRYGNKGRGLPDVAAKADVNGGYRIVVAGQTMSMGGTSAASPLWAALLARFNEALGTRVGFIVPWLYAHAWRPAIRDVTHGRTGVYRAGRRGWNPCTGLGTPAGVDLLRRMGPSRNSPTEVSSR